MAAYIGWAKSRYTVINYILYTYFWPTLYIYGDRGGTVVKVLWYKSEGRWFHASWCQKFDIKSFRSHHDPGVDSACNKQRLVPLTS